MGLKNSQQHLKNNQNPWDTNPYKPLKLLKKPEKLNPVDIYYVDKKAPKVRKKKTVKLPLPKVNQYLTTGVLLVNIETEKSEPNKNTKQPQQPKPKQKKFVIPPKQRKCYEQNWDEFKSPDQFVKFTEHHPSQHKLLKILVHRAKAANHCDIKIRDEDIAALMGISTRYVRKLIQELVAMGCIGRCWTRFQHPETGKVVTWRMLRIHYNMWKFRWDFRENITRLRSDFRPKSRILSRVTGAEPATFKAFVQHKTKSVVSSRGNTIPVPVIHPKWMSEGTVTVIEDEIWVRHYDSPWSYQDMSLYQLQEEGMYDLSFDETYDMVKTARYVYEKEWGSRLMGKTHDTEKGITV